MCKSPIHVFLQALPKCEHHIHLEGALTPSLLFELAARNNTTLPADDHAFLSAESLRLRYDHFTSLDDFLNYYYIGMSVLIHSSDFEALAWSYFQRAAADGVHHAEVFFDPQAHTSRGVAYSTVLSGFTIARDRACKELGMSTELICCFLRHLPPADCLVTFNQAELQESFEHGAVAGIGLDSSELDFPPQLFGELYRKAGEQGLRRTAHAGEEGPAAYIANAIDTLGVERIDHGIKLAEDGELMRRVAESGIMLTTCPLSNVLLRCVKSVAEVPIRRFLDAGVRFSINSDDPAYFGGYILDNYCAVQEAHNLSVAEWESICRASIEGSWCEQDRKDELLQALQRVMHDWTGRPLV
ncbi:adenosine deaminase [Coniosporium apollinis CBS 100218]|uniref:Adenine deaminase n=1 Tax=Coniosporium apollinis (strain CBS 100218) TaxID=1168221 RepID=R7YKB7_CONA1|nr:adenosine deaminase [Coniosporium apollinis CBS 100218]EON62328.1 adenosine deaminase [Coniosporium apollinis CBS 100218]